MNRLVCDHCTLSFPEKDAIRVSISGEEKTFCCTGCEGVYRIIHTEGLDSFYASRDWHEEGAAFLQRGSIDVRPFTEFVTETDGGMSEIDIYIEGIRCASCVWLNEKYVSRAEGVESMRVNYATHRARIRWNPSVIGLQEILNRILAIGYLPKPYTESEQFRARRSETRDLIIRFGTASFLSMQLMLYTIALYAGYFQGIDRGIKILLQVLALIFATPVVFYAGMPFIRNTITGLKRLHFNMDALIATGSVSAYCYSVYGIFTGGEVYFDTASMIVTLILLGRWIESSAKTRASQTLERLAELAPKEARVVDANGERTIVPIAGVEKGALIEVLPGERIPLDGRVNAGDTEVDEALITGESRPVAKSAGSAVIGGSINRYGAFTFTVEKTGKDTILSGIIRAVEEAQARAPQIQSIADRVVGYFVPFIFLLSAGTLGYHLWVGSSAHISLMTAISVLVIACPCSLGLATPLAILIASTTASKAGILVKGGDVLERAATVKDVFFDKTGTLTQGAPAVTRIIPFGGSSPDAVITLAAKAEARSEHSLAKAILAASPVNAAPADTLTAHAGEGITAGWQEAGAPVQAAVGNRALMERMSIPLAEADAQAGAIAELESNGNTVVYAASNGRLAGVIAIADTLRPEAAAAIDALHRLRVRTCIISGDNARTTAAISREAGTGDHLAEAKPVDKQEKIRQAQAAGHGVMMIGDGINDAPALTEARVGIAMGKGTDIAMESADAVFTREDLRLAPFFLRLARKTFRVIKQNIFWALFYNMLALPLAMAGVLHPIASAAAMAASSLIVVMNSLRIRSCHRYMS